MMEMFALGAVLGAMMGIFIAALCTISAIDDARREAIETMRGDPGGPVWE